LLGKIKTLESNQLPEGITQEQIDEMKQAAERERAEKERIELEMGKFDEVKQRIISEKDEEINGFAQKYQQLEGEYNNALVQNYLNNVLAESELSHVAEALHPHLAPHFGVVMTEDGRREVKVMSGAEVAKNDKGDEKSAKEVLAELQAKPAFQPLFGNTNSGGGADGSHDNGLGNKSNPFKTGNMSEQVALKRKNPALAKEMAKAAGKDTSGW